MICTCSTLVSLFCPAASGCSPVVVFSVCCLIVAELCVWSRVATRGTPPVPRHFHNTVVVGDMLYVFGGYDGNAWRNDIVGLHIRTRRSRHATLCAVL